MTKILKRPISILLAVLMIAGIFTALPLTAYAAPTETLLTTITATGKEQANYSTANVATVSFSYTAGGSSAYLANWGWWGYGWTATVNAAEGYTITKCVFYDDANRTATDSSSPFVVETTEEDKTPQVNGTPILAYTSKGIKKIEVYGYATPTYTVTWKNGDTVIETDTGVAEGSTPTYNGTTPVKAEDENNTYTFSGWSPAIAPVSGDVTYTAQFTATPKHTEHTYEKNPTFNWSQDASTGDWNCNKLTLTCSECTETKDYEVTGFFGASVVTCTADADGNFTYSVSKKVGDVTYNDSKTYNAGGVVKSATQLKAAAKKGGSWELGANIDGAVNVVCADGFVLDGKNHTVTRNSNVDTNPVFRITANPAEVTIKNLTIDGISGRSNSKSAIATKQSNPSSGNVLNLENVTITNYDFDAANNGVVLAWGEATVNMKNCTVDTDSDYDVWGGAASTVNVDGGTVGGLYLNGGTSSANLTNGADVTSISASNGATIKTDDPSIITAPEGYKVKENGDGTYSIVAKDYVAQIASTKYENLQDALDVVPDGGTVTVLKDITTSGNIFADGFVSGGNRTYTVDLGGYTVSGATFIVDSGNNVTFKNGTIESATYGIQNKATATIDSTATVKSTATDASAVFGDTGSTTNINGTVEGNKYGVIARGGTLNVAGKVTATNDDGRAITLNKGGAADINDGADIDGAYGVVVHKDANLNVNGGDIAGVYHAVSGNGTAADGPYTINVTGGTLTATNGAGIYNPNATGTMNISGGTITGSTTAVAAGTNSTNSISGGTFSSAVPEEYCATGFQPKTNGDGTYTVEVKDDVLTPDLTKEADGNKFGLGDLEYHFGTLLGVQKKNAVAGAEKTSENEAQENGNDLRFVAVLKTDILRNAQDYGFVLAKVNSSKTTESVAPNINALSADGVGNGEKVISAKGSSNTICGDYGEFGTDTSYKYITCAVNSVEDGTKVVARFYVKIGGKTYYAQYPKGGSYASNFTAAVAGMSDLG